ncbi:MAG: hypothetical protein U9R79_12250 [Armatimonadota bacterium]|nr:hypothetical protein [Armatimonadota bacterium]
MTLPVGESGEDPVQAAKEYIRRGQRRLAIELLEPWVEEYPEDADAWSVLAAAQFELDSFAGAVEAARRAVELKPSARNWCNLGMVLRKLGQLYEAERAQYKALVVDSGYDRARTELRKIHEIRTGQRTLHRQRFDDM